MEMAIIEHGVLRIILRSDGTLYLVNGFTNIAAGDIRLDRTG